MTCEFFKATNFRASSLAIIKQANAIIDEYQADGYDLTLRQLYYQFVARDMFPEDRRWTWTGRKWVRDANGTKNADPNYKWLGVIVNDSRLAGLTDWDAIKDRTREVKHLSHWDNAADIIDSAAQSFALDTREGQELYVEVWVEKEALAGVIKRACEEIDVPWFACRGYVSQTAMYEAAARFKEAEGFQDSTIFHLGDHDPSGIDMTRDIQDRLEMFGCRVDVTRIALNMPQVKKYKPPPNPAKLTDSRCGGYITKYGSESWELDALDPHVLVDLIQGKIEECTDIALLKQRRSEQREHKKLLSTVSKRWNDVIGFLNGRAK